MSAVAVKPDQDPDQDWNVCDEVDVAVNGKERRPAVPLTTETEQSADSAPDMQSSGSMQVLAPNNIPNDQKYSRVVQVQEERMKRAQPVYLEMEEVIKQMPRHSRDPYQSSTFVQGSLQELLECGPRMVKAGLHKGTDIPDECIEFAQSVTQKLMTGTMKQYSRDDDESQNVDDEKRSDILHYVDLSKEFGGKSDVLAIVLALCPHPVDDDVWYFYFAFYGEKWKEHKDFKLNDELLNEEKLHDWLSFKLWASCLDTLKIIKASADVPSDPDSDF